MISLFAIVVPSGLARDLNYLWFASGAGDAGSYERYEHGMQHLAKVKASYQMTLLDWAAPTDAGNLPWSFGSASGEFGNNNVDSFFHPPALPGGPAFDSSMRAGVELPSPVSGRTKKIGLAQWSILQARNGGLVGAPSGGERPRSPVAAQVDEAPIARSNALLPNPFLTVAFISLGFLRRRRAPQGSSPAACPVAPTLTGSGSPPAAGYNESTNEPRRTRVRRYRIRRVSTLYYLP